MTEPLKLWVDIEPEPYKNDRLLVVLYSNQPDEKGTSPSIIAVESYNADQSQQARARARRWREQLGLNKTFQINITTDKVLAPVEAVACDMIEALSIAMEHVAQLSRVGAAAARSVFITYGDVP